MAGEADLDRLLAELAPALDATVWGFASLPQGQPVPPSFPVLARFEEAEGTSVIAPAGALSEAGIGHEAGFARITLTVHSSLSAVGLTAAVAEALARAGIGANVVAAFHHDHLFVPWPRRHDAIAVLSRLSRGARAGMARAGRDVIPRPDRRG